LLNILSSKIKILHDIFTLSLLVELSNGDTIYLRSLPSNKIGDFVKQAKELCLIDESLERVHATGGGAYKYSKLFEDEFSPMGIKLIKHDEMESLVNGMAFVLNYAKDPAFTMRTGEGKKYLTEGL
jgi:pantothenate kinase